MEPGAMSVPESHGQVVAEAQRWLAAEPDADLRDELSALIAGPADELLAVFAGRLQFGTAGLRAAIGPGPMRMNRLVVRQAAAGLARYLLDTDPNAAERGVIIAFDARRKSDLFAADTARVLAAHGIRAIVFAEPMPTPVLAWSITEVGAAAGVYAWNVIDAFSLGQSAGIPGLTWSVTPSSDGVLMSATWSMP